MVLVQTLVKSSSLLRAVVPSKVLFAIQKAPSGRLLSFWALNGVALACVVVSWLNPNHYHPWVVFENEAVAFAGILLAAMALMLRGRVASVASGYLALVLFTMFAVLAQYGMDMVSWQSLGLGYLYLGAFALSIVVGYGLHHDVTTVTTSVEKSILFSVLLATMISSCIVLSQWLHIESYYPLAMSEHGSFRPFGNLGQPNNQGTLLVTGVLCAELMLRSNTISPSVAGVSLLILLPAIAATGSRTAILSATVAVAFLLFFTRPRKYGFTLGWFLSLVALYFIMPHLVSTSDTNGLRLSERLSDSPRLHIYNQLIWAIFDKPWTGYGWMQTAYAQSLAAAHIFGGVETDFAHNIVIDFLVWFGVPLGIFLLLTFVFTVLGNWRRSEIKYKIAYVLFVPFGVHSLLEFPFAYAFFLLPVGVLLGYLGGHAAARGGCDSIPSRPGWVIFTALLVCTTLLATTVCDDYLELAEDFRVLRFENKKIGSLPDGFQQSSPVVLTDMRLMMDLLRYKPRRAESEEMVEQLRHYVLRAHYPGAHVKLISLEILNQRFEVAADEIHRFKNLYGEQVVNWGISSLQAAYCEGTMNPEKSQQACCLVSSKSPCISDLTARAD